MACRQVGVCRYYRIIDSDLLKLCAEANQQIERELQLHKPSQLSQT